MGEDTKKSSSKLRSNVDYGFIKPCVCRTVYTDLTLLVAQISNSASYDASGSGETLDGENVVLCLALRVHKNI